MPPISTTPGFRKIQKREDCRFANNGSFCILRRFAPFLPRLRPFVASSSSRSQGQQRPGPAFRDIGARPSEMIVRSRRPDGLGGAMVAVACLLTAVGPVQGFLGHHIPGTISAGPLRSTQPGMAFPSCEICLGSDPQACTPLGSCRPRPCTQTMAASIARRLEPPCTKTHKPEEKTIPTPFLTAYSEIHAPVLHISECHVQVNAVHISSWGELGMSSPLCSSLRHHD